VLARVAERAPGMLRKSGLMVGLGETRDEVAAVLSDLRDAGCQVVTIGQYLQPTPDQVRVARFWRPEEFAELERLGRGLGLEVLAGPFVRSSYRAEEAFLKVAGS
jgi:lipoic acid synthetase